MTCNLATNEQTTSLQASPMMAGRAIALMAHLKPLQLFLSMSDATEIVINRPQEIQIETHQGWAAYPAPDVSFDYCQRLTKLIATYSGQKLDTSHPILSATLPDGERVQIAIPPVTQNGTISLTIRKPSKVNFTLEDYQQQGYFIPCERLQLDMQSSTRDQDSALLTLKQQGKIKALLTLAVQLRKNIIVSGSTGTGKTTFIKSLLQLVPKTERLISIENVDELQLYRTHPNTVSLFYSAGHQGIAPVTQQQLLESSLRMKPDRVLVAELIRGDEAFYFLRNINSGHPGSMTSMHAGSPKLAIEQLVLLLKESQAGHSLSRSDIKQLLYLCVDIIVQLQHVGGKRFVSEVYLCQADC